MKDEYNKPKNKVTKEKWPFFMEYPLEKYDSMNCFINWGKFLFQNKLVIFIFYLFLKEGKVLKDYGYIKIYLIDFEIAENKFKQKVYTSSVVIRDFDCILNLYKS